MYLTRKRKSIISEPTFLYKNTKKRQIEHDENSNQDEHEQQISKLPVFENMFGEVNDVYIEENHIYFRTDVELDTVSRLCKLIQSYNNKVNALQTHPLFESTTPKPIYLHITTYGGCVHSSLLAHDCIKNSKIPVHTIIEGYCASGGTIMSLAGAKRYITSQAQVLIHQLRAGIYGKYNEIEEEMTNKKEMMKKIVKIYQTGTRGKMTKKQIEDALKHDYWWDATKCISLGLCDSVYV